MNLFIPRLSESDQNIPSVLQPWLSCQHSMTNKLRMETGDARLLVLNQSLVSASWWDHYVLNLGRQSIIARDIIMSAHAIPCWYARTIIPEDTYNRYDMIFSRLKNESLGEIIFSDECIKRKQLLPYRLDYHCLEYYWFRSFIDNDIKVFWARMSVFTIHSVFPFFLVEIILPGLLDILQVHSPNRILR